MRTGDGQLIHLLVVTALQIDDLTLGRAGDQDHRPAVGGGMGQRGQAVEEARRRNRHADARLLGEEARGGGGIAGVLLVTERQNAQALRLRIAAQIRDRNTGNVVDRLNAVDLQRVDEQMETVGEIVHRLSGFRAGHCCRHLVLPPKNQRNHVVFCVRGYSAARRVRDITAIFLQVRLMWS